MIFSPRVKESKSLLKLWVPKLLEISGAIRVSDVWDGVQSCSLAQKKGVQGTMGKSRFTTSSRKKQHIPTAAVCVEQSNGKLSPALLSCTRTETGKKREIADLWDKPVRMMPSPCSLLNCPLSRWPGKSFIPLIIFSVVLALSLKQKPQKLPGDLILTIYFPR